MNGATKPAGWTNSSTAPLDPTYGAGIVNAFNSYENLAAGRKLPTAVTGDTTPVTGSTTTNIGWDLNTLTTTRNTNAVAHYLLNVAGDSVFTSTLTWDRPAGTVTDDSIESTTINQFDLLLLNPVTGDVMESVSQVDNVQYLYTADLPAGVYDLEVVKEGTDAESATDTYALAFNAQLINDLVGMSSGGAVETEQPPTITPEPASLMVLALGLAVPLRRHGRGRN